MASNFNVKFLNHLEFNLVDGVMSESTFFFPRWSQVFKKYCNLGLFSEEARNTSLDP